MSAPELTLRPLRAADRALLREVLAREWGGAQIVSRGRVHDAAQAEAIGAFRDTHLVGLVTYVNEGEQCEVLTLNALEAGRGIGSALLDAATRVAREAGCRRLWLITTNENHEAIRFYERRGMRLVAVHRDALDESRRLKSSIPEFAADGTRISDELEFEFDLAEGARS